MPAPLTLLTVFLSNHLPIYQSIIMLPLTGIFTERCDHIFYVATVQLIKVATAKLYQLLDILMQISSTGQPRYSVITNAGFIVHTKHINPGTCSAMLIDAIMCSSCKEPRIYQEPLVTRCCCKVICSQCSVKFKRKNNIKKLVRPTHENPLKCPYCDEKTQGRLRNHHTYLKLIDTSSLKTISSLPVECPSCSHDFNAHSINKHIANTHPEIKRDGSGLISRQLEIIGFLKETTTRCQDWREMSK